MCGIIGEAHPGAEPLDEAPLHRMCDAIIHRGPDGEGYYTSPAGATGAVGLGMRRLAIVDLVTGQQPIHNEDRTVWVVLNGEIYNYPALKEDLESKGHSFYTKSDTEAIVHAYEEYGLDVPSKLRGMFAFALWDEREERLLIARDRVGKKPLLYYEHAGRLVFGSEFQALLRHPAVSREIDPQAIPHYLSFMCVPAPLTAFAGIRKLEPGCMLTWKAGELNIRRYWSLDFDKKLDISEDEAAERAIALLKEAVKVRLMSDVPLGAFLSGGVDSSAVVALMSDLTPGRVKTFSINFDERDFSEIHHARRVADRFGTDHHEFTVRPDAIEVLPMLVRHYGEPYADSSSIPTYYLSKMTRDHVTVALNGDGGDECFAGYERYAAMRLSEHYHRLPPGIRKRLIDPAIRRLPEGGIARSRVAKARRFLSVMGLERTDRYLRWSSAISEDLKSDLLTPAFAKLAGGTSSARFLQPWLANGSSLDVVDRALKADTETYLPNDLLVKVDIASMAASLEARSPFLDHHVMEFAASLPAETKLRGLATKRLLKKALGGVVPAQNLVRGKMGFGVPISHWLRAELKEFAKDLLLSEKAQKRGYFNVVAVARLLDDHQSGKRDRAHQVWTLMMLELWHREFIDG